MADSSIVGATFTVAHQVGLTWVLLIITNRGIANMGRGNFCPEEVILDDQVFSVIPAEAGIRAPGSRRDLGGESPPPGDARSR